MVLWPPAYFRKWVRWSRAEPSRAWSSSWLTGLRAFVNHACVALFTLELRRQGLLVLLVLQRHRLGSPQLFVHLVGHHPPVEHSTGHGDQQETLEDPPLPPGTNPVSHVGPAALPAVCASKPRLCCWELPSQLLSVPVKPEIALSVTLRASPVETLLKLESLLTCALF